MALSPEEFETLTKRLRELWGNKPCLMCQSPKMSFSVIGTITMPLTDTSGAPQIMPTGQAAMPMAAVACETCGYTTFVNLLFAGVVPSTPKGPPGG